MIRFSLVIINKNNEYLICECPPSNTETGRYEFLGDEIATDTLPSIEWLKQQIVSVVNQKVGIQIDNIQKYEIYWHDEPPLWIHAIFTATIKSGNPQKRFYTKLLWLPEDKIDVHILNVFGMQVYRKIKECNYCHLLHDRKTQLDEFFTNFFSREEENLTTLKALKSTKKDNPIYKLVFKQELIHLRAFLIESTKLNKNITVQNYFRLYNRNDLAEKIDALLQIEVKTNLSLRHDKGKRR
jgi:hypothetical protein